MPRTEIPKSATDYTPAKPDQGTMASLFAPPPEPATELGRYRILSSRAGVRVSPLCLGAMSLGDQWPGFMGNNLSPADSEKLLDAFYDAGGNFIDTANNYQDEQSELIIGEWMEKRNNREDIVLATKFTSYAQGRKEGRQKGIGANYTGNHRKNLFRTVEDSLKKLKTDYIDILYLHWWDYTTSVEEVMTSLNDLVRMGKVHYLGVSDTPAWLVAQANTWAREHALQPFIIYQGNWSLSLRDMERDIIPMCRAFGMAVAPWGALGGGKYKTPEELKEREKENTLRGGMAASERDIQVSAVLAEVAKELGGEPALASVALAWIRQMYPDCYPIVGGTKLHHLQGNIEALKIRLSDEQVDKLAQAVDFDWGFPYSFFGRDGHSLPGGRTDSGILNSAAHLQFVPYPKGL